MSKQKLIPVDPATVLHHADEKIFERKLKLKAERIDDWPYWGQDEYMQTLEQLAQKYNIQVDHEGKYNKKVDFRLVNRFVASFPNAFLEYKKKSNVSQIMKKYKFITAEKSLNYEKMKTIVQELDET